MSKTHSPSADLRGLSRLTIAAIVGVTELVEAVHLNILQRTGKPLSGPTSMGYRSVRGISRLARRTQRLARARGGAGGVERRTRRLPGRQQ